MGMPGLAPDGRQPTGSLQAGALQAPVRTERTRSGPTARRGLEVRHPGTGLATRLQAPGPGRPHQRPGPPASSSLAVGSMASVSFGPCHPASTQRRRGAKPDSTSLWTRQGAARSAPSRSHSHQYGRVVPAEPQGLQSTQDRMLTATASLDGGPLTLDLDGTGWGRYRPMLSAWEQHAAGRSGAGSGYRFDSRYLVPPPSFFYFPGLFLIPGWALSTPVRVPGRRPRPVRPATGRRRPRLAQPGQRMRDSPRKLPLGTYRSAARSREVHGRWREVRSGEAGAGTGAGPEVHDEGACGFWSDEATCRVPRPLPGPEPMATGFETVSLL